MSEIAHQAPTASTPCTVDSAEATNAHGGGGFAIRLRDLSPEEKGKLTRERVEYLARIYHTPEYAAEATGHHLTSVLRAAKKFDIKFRKRSEGVTGIHGQRRNRPRTDRFRTDLARIDKKTS